MSFDNPTGLTIGLLIMIGFLAFMAFSILRAFPETDEEIAAKKQGKSLKQPNQES